MILRKRLIGWANRMLAAALVVAATCQHGQAQTTLLLNSATNGTTINSACSYNFYDSGGSGANYSNNQSYTLTLCAPSGQNLRLDFRNFVVAAGDNLKIYDGSSTAATLLGTYQATSPGVVKSSSTCLTVQFTSDASGTAAGWFATVSCQTPTNCTSTLLANGSFDTDTTGWTSVNGTVSNQARYLMDGGANILWLQWATGTATVTQTVSTGIMQGQTYWLRGYAGTHEPAYDHTVALKFYNASNTLLASSTYAVEHDVDPLNNLGYFEIYLNAPTGATYAKVVGSATGDYLKLDGLCMSSTATAPTCNVLCNPDAAHVFSIAAVSGATGYTWLIDGSSTSSSIVSGQGTVALTVNLTTLSVGNHTICVTANGSSGCSSPPQCICVTLPTVTSVSATGGQACEGGTISLTATGSGGTGPYSYSWAGPGGFTSTSQNPTRSSATTAMAGTYTVTVTDASSCTGTATATIMVNATPTTTLDNATICTGGTANFTASVSSGTATSWQWQSSSDGTTFSNISAATNSSYSATNITATTYYRAIALFSGACSQMVSANSLVTVVADPSISSQPSGGTICVGGTLDLTATATGGTPSLTYQWQYFNGSTWANVANGLPAGSTYSGQTTATLTVANISVAGSYGYRILVNASGNGCGQAVSSTATVVVVADPTISISGGGTFCESGSTTLTATTSGGTGTCTTQWQQSTTGANFTDISGATGNSYTTPVLTVSTWFRATRTCGGSECGLAISGAIEIEIVPRPDISIGIKGN